MYHAFINDIKFTQIVLFVIKGSDNFMFPSKLSHWYYQVHLRTVLLSFNCKNRLIMDFIKLHTAFGFRDWWCRSHCLPIID